MVFESARIQRKNVEKSDALIRCHWPMKYQVSLCLFAQICTAFRKQFENIQRLFQQHQMEKVSPKRLGWAPELQKSWRSRAPPQQFYLGWNRIWNLMLTLGFSSPLTEMSEADGWRARDCLCALFFFFGAFLPLTSRVKTDLKARITPETTRLGVLAPTPQCDLQGKKGKKHALAETRGTIRPLIGNLVITGLSTASLCELPICGCVINFLLRGGKKRRGGNPVIITQAWQWFVCRRCSIDFQSDVTATCVGKNKILALNIGGNLWQRGLTEGFRPVVSHLFQWETD